MPSGSGLDDQPELLVILDMLEHVVGSGEAIHINDLLADLDDLVCGSSFVIDLDEPIFEFLHFQARCLCVPDVETNLVSGGGLLHFHNESAFWRWRCCLCCCCCGLWLWCCSGLRCCRRLLHLFGLWRWLE